MALALLVGLGTTLWQARIAQQNYERAERRFADVRRLANSFLFEMDEPIAKLPGSTSVRGGRSSGTGCIIWIVWQRSRRRRTRGSERFKGGR